MTTSRGMASPATIQGASTASILGESPVAIPRTPPPAHERTAHAPSSPAVPAATRTPASTLRAAGARATGGSHSATGNTALPSPASDTTPCPLLTVSPWSPPAQARHGSHGGERAEHRQRHPQPDVEPGRELLELQEDPPEQVDQVGHGVDVHERQEPPRQLYEESPEAHDSPNGEDGSGEEVHGEHDAVGDAPEALEGREACRDDHADGDEQDPHGIHDRPGTEHLHGRQGHACQRGEQERDR